MHSWIICKEYFITKCWGFRLKHNGFVGYTLGKTAVDSIVLDSHQLWTHTVDVFTVCYAHLQISLYNCKRNTGILYLIATVRMLVPLLSVFRSSSREDKKKKDIPSKMVVIPCFIRVFLGVVACVLSLFHYGFMKYNIKCGNLIIIVWAVLFWWDELCYSGCYASAFLVIKLN
jgi:hypothetical protein